MHRRLLLPALLSQLALSTLPALSEQSVESKTQTIKDTLVVLCLAGGSESFLTAKADVDLCSKIKDILTGNIGLTTDAGTTFSKHVWEGIIGGISKDITHLQSEQANAARKCMVDNGFDLISKVLSQK